MYAHRQLMAKQGQNRKTLRGHAGNAAKCSHEELGATFWLGESLTNTHLFKTSYTAEALIVVLIDWTYLNYCARTLSCTRHSVMNIHSSAPCLPLPPMQQPLLANLRGS